MQKIILLLLLFSSLQHSYAQKAVIKISGCNSKYLAIVSAFSKKNDKIFLQIKNSTEYVEIKQVIPKQVYLLGINNKVCFFIPTPNDTTEIKVNGEHFLFSGAGKVWNDYLANWSYKTFYTLPNVWVNNYMSQVLCNNYIYDKIESIQEIKYTTEIKNLYHSCLNDLKHSGIKDPVFLQQQKQRIEYLYWKMLASTYRHLAFKSLQIPPSLIETLDHINFKKSVFSDYGDLAYFINTFLQIQETKGKLKFTMTNYVAQKARTLKDQDTREYYILEEIGKLIKRNELIFLQEIMNSCEPLVQSKKNIILFQEIKAKGEKLLAEDTLNGIPAYPFEFKNQKEQIVKLSDFKGKYVYIDIWATWCGPCKQEIPKLQQLEKELKGENMAFISISVDRPNDIPKWKEFLQEHKMHGITLHSDNGFKTPFVRKYGINAIPRFMLIDPEGKMISHNCWRPGDPRLKKYLKTLLHPQQKQ